MEVQQDFRNLLELFNAHGVDYIIVGAHALAYHGVPRYTGDIDIFVRPDSENAHRILGQEQFIANKKALGRKKDLADLEALEKD